MPLNPRFVLAICHDKYDTEHLYLLRKRDDNGNTCIFYKDIAQDYSMRT